MHRNEVLLKLRLGLGCILLLIARKQIGNIACRNSLKHIQTVSVAGLNSRCPEIVFERHQSESVNKQ